MVNMWEQIRSNRRRTVVLVVLIALLLFVLGFVAAEALQPGAGFIGLAVAMAIWIVMSLVAYFKGDNILLAVSGAREIQHSDHPRLFNVVEEMAIAAGLPKVPRVYIIDDMALNAFATGRKPENAAVAVTAGLLGKLNRDELQGVIAHEMSHVINRDVLLMTMVGVLLGAIVMVAEVFLRGMWLGSGSRRYSSSRRQGGGAQGVMAILAIVLALLAPLLAQIIYFAISRRREYLADANAAVLTRYPEGLASALSAIAHDGHELAKANKATAPMYIANPFHKPGKMALSLVATHPPIDQRIKILRSMAGMGAASYQQYDEAFRKVGGSGGVMPASALAAGEGQAIRAPRPDEARDARQRMREAGDLLRKVNRFVFLPCACGMRIKLPPDFKKDTMKCPRCHRELTVPVAELAGVEAAAGAMARQATAPPTPPPVPGRNVVAAAPLRVKRQGSGWTSFKCTCGNTVTLSPSQSDKHTRCSRCGRRIEIG